MKMISLVMVVLLGSATSARAGRGGGGHSSGGHHASHASSGTGSSSHSHSVSGYTTKRGTTVAPHHQTDANHTQRDNYSTKGNTNSWTGKAGTKTATH